jgi:transposase
VARPSPDRERRLFDRAPRHSRGARHAAHAAVSGRSRLGDWKNTHTRFSRWAKSGVWESLFKALADDPDNEYVMIGATIVNAPAALRQALDDIIGKMAPIRHLAAPRPGPMTSVTASAKGALRAIARRWLMRDAEIKAHDADLDALTASCAPIMLEAHEISTGTAAEMLILAGDNPERIRSEAAFAKLRGACPIPASRGKTNRHRLNRGGNRQANAALYRGVIVRMRNHPPTLDYVKKRKADGKGKMEIIRCLKRFVVREILGYSCGARRSLTSLPKTT